MHDATDLLHGEEKRVWAIKHIAGKVRCLREHAPHALDLTTQRYR